MQLAGWCCDYYDRNRAYVPFSPQAYRCLLIVREEGAKEFNGSGKDGNGCSSYDNRGGEAHEFIDGFFVGVEFIFDVFNAIAQRFNNILHGLELFEDEG